MSAKGMDELANVSGDVAIWAELLIEIQGQCFAYAGEAIGWNSREVLIRTSAPLALGSEITIHVPRTGRSTPALIVSEAREVSHFGVDLTAPDSFWDGPEAQRREQRSL
jgi:hypothetical protein